MKAEKKILLVSNGFYPEISPRSFRATELAKEFHRQGYNVTVISKFRDYNYSAFLEEFPINFKMIAKPSFRAIPESGKKLLSVLTRGLSRLLRLLFEYPAIEEMFAIRKILRTEDSYDLMISFAVPYPVHWGVAWARSMKHKIADVWIADCGDPYMGCRTDSFRKLFYFSYIEKWFCRKADFISIPHENARGGYYPEFQGKIRIIPQGFEFDLPIKKKNHIPNKIPVFAYAGAFIKDVRDPGEFLNFLSSLTREFKFVIYTRQNEIVETYRERLNGKLILNDYIPRDKLLNELSQMDFLVNFDNNTEIQLPSKLIDYAIADRPVLNIRKGFHTDDVISFINGNYSSRMILPDIGQYHISSIARQFIELGDLKNSIA